MIKATGLFIFNKENKFLVEHPTNHDPNFWSIPKGIVESDEDPFDGAKRETYEETNLDIDTIKYSLISELPTIIFKNKRKSLKCFVIKTNEFLYDYPFKCESMVTQMRGKILNNPFPEVDDFKWVTIEEGYDLLHESQKRAIDILKEKNILEINVIYTL